MEALKTILKGRAINSFLLYGLPIFMLVAGINHFVNPQFYLPLIPDYLPFPKAINTISGISEIVVSILLVVKKTRKIGALGVIILLILFIPSHIYFIQLGACIPKGLCTPLWVAWVRLILIHPLFIYWAMKIKLKH